jgi:ribose/xylose/arabinose/galactoside ABC-type transport system permease subunit
MSVANRVTRKVTQALPRGVSERFRPHDTETTLGPVEWAAYLFQKVGTVLIAVALLVFFSKTTPDFFTEANLDNILIQIAVIGVVAMGETFVMLLRGIDLSVGSVTLFSAVTIGVLNVHHHTSVMVAIAVALILSLGIGIVNGILVALVRIEPIIVTLGTGLAILGLDQRLLADNGSWIQILDPFFFSMATNKVLFLPVMAVILFALYIAAGLLLRKTPFGRYVYAVGGNPRASHLAGIPGSLVLLAAYAICGLCAGIAGILLTAEVPTISPAVGGDLLFSAITVVVVGGLSLAGGAGSVEKTLVGAIIFGMIYNYLTLQSFSIYYKQAIAGFLILGAAVLIQLGRIRSER